MRLGAGGRSRLARHAPCARGPDDGATTGASPLPPRRRRPQPHRGECSARRLPRTASLLLRAGLTGPRRRGRPSQKDPDAAAPRTSAGPSDEAERPQPGPLAGRRAHPAARTGAVAAATALGAAALAAAAAPAAAAVAGGLLLGGAGGALADALVGTPRQHEAFVTVSEAGIA
jgi:hypothetical protein